MAVAGEVDRQFGVLTFTFAFDYQSHAVLGMPDARSDLQSCWAYRAARGAFIVGTRARFEIAGVDLPALPGEKFLYAVGAIVSPSLIIVRSSRGRRRRRR